MFPAALIWLVLLIIFAVAEGLTAGLVSIWFALGALASLIVSFFTDNVVIQVGLFVVVSLIAMAIIRPLARKYFTPHQVPTNFDRILGQEGIVTVAIDNLQAVGQVKVAGQVWTARSADDRPIPADSLVRILRIEGVKVYVEPVKVPAAK